MKYGSNVMAILLLLGNFSTMRSQEVETNGLQDRQSIRLPVTARIVAHGSSREFLGVPSRHRLHTNSVTGLGNDRVNPDRLHRGSNSALAKSSPQSRTSVIDTAIVRSFGDTTRHVYTFDARAKMISDLTQTLKGDAWLDNGRFTYTYDGIGNLLSHLDEYWENGQWVNSMRFTYTYDANGNKLSQLFEGWSNSQWVNSSRSTYTYDAHSNRLNELHEEWSNGQWVNSSRNTYTYDAHSNRLNELHEEWSNGQWVNSYHFSYSYDANGNMLSDLYEQYSQLKDAYRSKYTYDANGNMLSELREYWSQGQLKDAYRNTYTYDANGRQTSTLREKWSNSQWVNDYRYTYTYDTQGNLTSVWFHKWLNSTWIPTDFLNGVNISDSAGNHYYLGKGYNLTFTYRMIVTGVVSGGGNIAATYSLSQNYPNPFNPATTIGYGLPARSQATLTVFNTLGQQVAQLVNGEREAGYHEVKFDGSKLASGVYLYRMQAGDFVETRKLLLMK